MGHVRIGSFDPARLPPPEFGPMGWRLKLYSTLALTWVSSSSAVRPLLLQACDVFSKRRGKVAQARPEETLS